MLRIDPAFPIQPKLSGIFCVQVVLDLKSQPAREVLRAFPDDEMVVRLLHYRFGYQRRCPHALDAGHPAGPAFRSVHATGIKLHHAVGVGQPAVTDAVIERIQLDDVHPGDQGIEHVGIATRHHRERLLDARHVAAILEFVPVRRSDHDRLD